MKYVALLRGINVGGNNAVKMSELKIAFEQLGHTNVLTYINSGNVIFESDESDSKKLTQELEKVLTKTFNFSARLLVLSHSQMKRILSEVPIEWNTDKDIRCYVTFVMADLTTTKAAQEVEVREGIDMLKVGTHVLYMTTKMSGLTKSKFTKIIGKKIFQDMTMRNYNTTQKLFALMEKDQ